MKKAILKILIIICGVALLLIVQLIFVGLLISGSFSPPISKERMERIFIADYENLSIARDYLIRRHGDVSFAISQIDKIDSSIGDIQAREAIHTLMQRRYRAVGKSGNTVYFLRWTALDRGRGIVYTIDGSEPELEFLIRLESLSKSSWYYYEEDFNEWRTRNQRTETSEEKTDLSIWQEFKKTLLLRIPEMIAFSLIVLVISKDIKNWKRAIWVGVMLAVMAHFGVHMIAIMVLSVALFYLLLNAEVDRIICGVLLAFLLTLVKYIFIFILLVFFPSFMQFTFEMTINEIFWQIMVVWPNIILMLIVAYLIFKASEQKEEKVSDSSTKGI